MHHIIYQSDAVGKPTIAELRFLLQQSRANNIRFHITGLLLYGNSSYLQVIEGEAETVQQLYAVIQADQRHYNVLTLSDGPISQRVFPNWTMGFQLLSGDDFARLAGYVNPLRNRLLEAQLMSIDEGMLVLLKSFMVEDGFQL